MNEETTSTGAPARSVILIIDDSQPFHDSMSRAFKKEYRLLHALSEEEVWNQLSPSPDVILLDLQLDPDERSDRSGIKLLKALRERSPAVPVIIVTGHDDISAAVSCMKLGAIDFLQKGRSNVREIRLRIERALKHQYLSWRVGQLERELNLVEPRVLIGEEESIQKLKRQIRILADDGQATVLVRGETGTGKELVARAIHQLGRRRAAPFVPVMINIFPEHLISGELFGAEAGAFTDAQSRRVGYIEEAHRGVLFLDEIGDVRLSIQGQLLRFLEERRFSRLGTAKQTKVDVQIVAATNTDLESKVEVGEFREDLYYRLKVHELHVPPLRERTGDIPLLCNYFLKIFRMQGKKVTSLTGESLDLLRRSDWPGNVRQLRNVLEAAVLRSEAAGHMRIEPPDLGVDNFNSEPAPSTLPASFPRLTPSGFNIKKALAYTELFYAEQALVRVDGGIAKAAELLGYNDRYTFGRRVRRTLKTFPHLIEDFPQIRRHFRE